MATMTYFLTGCTPSCWDIFPNVEYVFQDDGAPSNRVFPVYEWFEEHSSDPQPIDWPPNFLAIN